MKIKKKHKLPTTMYQIYKKDLWGNRVPYMVAEKPMTDEIAKNLCDGIALIVEVPRNVQSLIKM